MGHIAMKIRRKHNQNLSKGFTLVEILVVVVILAVLATLVIPNYRTAVVNATIDDAQTKLQLIRAAQRMYYLDEDVYTNGDLSSTHELVVNRYLDNLNVDTDPQKNPYVYSSVTPANDPPLDDDVIGRATARGGAAGDLPGPIEITYDGTVNIP